jgi:glyoxylase-like metal-dependent hydrolase (beta-lactamase superfamily II)
MNPTATRAEATPQTPAEASPPMATEIPGLLATAPQQLPFGPEHDIRAFLLQREAGNILVYSNTALEWNAEAIERAGGISRHYLNHHHEALFPSSWVDAPLFVHEAGRTKVEKAYSVRGTFAKRHTLDGEFEVVPIPGHTPDATAYLWDTGEHRLLFTGDSIMLNGGEWIAAVLESSDRERYLESLELIRELEFDVLVPWAARGDERPYSLTDRDDARRRIGAIIERVAAGSDR